MHTKDLITWFEHHFICSVGPARAGVEIEINGQRNTVYYTVFAASAYDIQDPETRLILALKADFRPVLEMPISRTLFWRHPWKIEFGQEIQQIYGDKLITEEERRDGLAVPAGAVQNFDTGAWHEDLGKAQVSQLYTRLCIPALAEMQNPLFSGSRMFKLAKKEGAPVFTLGEPPKKAIS